MKYLIYLFTISCVLIFPSFKNNTKYNPSEHSQDSLQVERNKYISSIKTEISGKENIAVHSVFKYLKVFGGFPAENLLIAMNSWSRALNVNCGYCHNEGDWASDSKPEKEIAREMSGMTSTINSNLLKNIKGLKNESPVINCTSCHNGKLKPALKIKD